MITPWRLDRMYIFHSWPLTFISYCLSHLFSMASMFLRSSKTCRWVPSSLSEKSRWWPVMHRVPLLGGWSGCRSTTSSTLAVLMWSENSISPTSSSKPPRCWNFNWSGLAPSQQITSSPPWEENESTLPPRCAQLVGQHCCRALFVRR